MQNYLKTLIINASKQQKNREPQKTKGLKQKSNIHQHKRNQQNVHSSKQIKRNGKSRPFFLNSSRFRLSSAIFRFLSNSQTCVGFTRSVQCKLQFTNTHHPTFVSSFNLFKANKKKQWNSVWPLSLLKRKIQPKSTKSKKNKSTKINVKKWFYFEFLKQLQILRFNKK